MSVIDILAVLAAGSAGWLLSGRSLGPAARIALLARAPDPPVTPPPLAAPRPAGVLLRGIAAVAPACTLALVFGIPAAVLLGLPVGCALWWRLGREDTGSSRKHEARVVAALPVTVELLVAALRAGCSMAVALDAVTRAIGGPIGRELGAAADRLRLGADPATVWREFTKPAELASLGRALARAATTGAPVADVLERLAVDLRTAARTCALASAQRAGVLAVLPLGLCFLPAFVLIGVVPMAAELLTATQHP